MNLSSSSTLSPESRGTYDFRTRVINFDLSSSTRVWLKLEYSNLTSVLEYQGSIRVPKFDLSSDIFVHNSRKLSYSRPSFLLRRVREPENFEFSQHKSWRIEISNITGYINITGYWQDIDNLVRISHCYQSGYKITYKIDIVLPKIITMWSKLEPPLKIRGDLFANQISYI